MSQLGTVLSPQEQAARETLTQLILSTKEADRARNRISSETELEEFCVSDPELQSQMQQKALDSKQVARELFRTEWLKATLEVASEGTLPVSDQEVRLYYDSHPDKWLQKERRLVFHILITVSSDIPENSEENARRRIDEVHARLSKGEAFGDLAVRHSECPTALQQGELGWMEPGQMFPALDAAAFALSEGQLSAPVRSELGWHVLLCQEIQPEGYRSFDEVADKLREALDKRRRIAAQRRWVAQVAQGGAHAS